MVEERKSGDIDVRKIRWWRRPRTARRRNLLQRVWRVLRLFYILLVRLDASPHQVATGFAVGAILGVLPTFGLGGPVAVALAFVFRFNKAATILGAMIMNPITTVPFWTASAFIGSAIWSAEYNYILEEVKTGRVFEAAKYSTMVYMTGNLILTAIVAIIGYGLVYYLVRRYETVKIRRRKEKQKTYISEDNYGE
ncbi:MAG: DUF2062 domain-containing protein [bacterium]|nr:DUF2062 domain-containing protein [bacterium]